MCHSLPHPYSTRKRIRDIVTQADQGRTIEEIASDLRVQHVIILIYLYLAVDLQISETTTTGLLKEDRK